MPPLNPKEQRELNRLQKEYEKVEDRIKQGKNLQNKTLEKHEKTQKRINQLLEKENELVGTQKDLLKEITKQYAIIDKTERKINISGDRFKDVKLKTLSVAKDILKEADKAAKADKKNVDLSKKTKDLVEDVLSTVTDLDALRELELEQQVALQKAEADGLIHERLHAQMALKVIGLKKKELEHIDDNNKAQEFGNELLGGFVGQAMEFLKASPIAQSIIAATVAMKILNDMMETYTDMTDAVGEEFGAGVLRSYGQDLKNVVATSIKYGKETDEVLKTVRSLSTEYGYSMSEAIKLTDSTVEMSVALGISTEHGANLVGMFTKMGGLTGQQAIDLAKSTYQLARANGLAPDQVMEDIADSTEYFAKYSKDGGENIRQASIHARKLGVNLSTVEKMAEGLLDLEESLNAEFEVSAMIGKRLNLTKAREFALYGKHEDMLKEIVKQVGSQAELEALLPIERAKLAKALNIEGKELATIVANQEKSKNLVKDISEMSFKELVGEDAMSGLTAFQKSLSTIAAVLTEHFIPPIAFVLGLFGKLVNWMSESTAGMLILKGAASALAGVLALLSWRAIQFAAGAIMKAAGILSISTAGMGTAAAYGVAAGVVAGMYNLFAKAPKPMAEGGLVAANPGGMSAVIGEGGQDELVTPLNKLGNLVSVDTSAVASEVSVLKGEMNKQNLLMNKLVDNMESYLGFGGTAVKGIGRETIKASESLL